MKNRQLAIIILVLSLLSALAFADIPKSTEQVQMEKMFKLLGNTVYTIFNITTDRTGTNYTPIGSAVAVSSHALVTNCHVALAWSIIKVKVNDKMLDASPTYQDSNNDLCIIDVPDAKFTPVKMIISSQDTQNGLEVFAIGSPDGLNKTVSKGKINNKTQEGKITLLQTDVTILDGSDGGGLFDINGNLVGILTKGISQGQNINFAIPGEVVSAAPLPAATVKKSEKKGDK